jgi:hypothetical protein
VECTSDVSLSVNISLMAASWADLVADALRQRLLCHPPARAFGCMRSVADGRRQLSEILDVAQLELARLTPRDLLPDAAALPRVVSLTLPCGGGEGEDAASGEGEGEGQGQGQGQGQGEGEGVGVGESVGEGVRVRRGRVRQQTRFRRNPLCVLLRAAGPEGADEESDPEDGMESMEGSEEDESGGDSDSTGMDEGTEGGEQGRGLGGARQRATRCGGGERLACAADLFLEQQDKGSNVARARFVLHSQFGSEDLQSLLRVEMRTPAPLVPLLEWLCAAPRNFRAKHAWRAAQRASISSSRGASSRAEPALPFETVAAVLRVLERNGFCSRRKKPKL